jgi:hypothetical protein
MTPEKTMLCEAIEKLTAALELFLQPPSAQIDPLDDLKKRVNAIRAIAVARTAITKSGSQT